MHQSFYKHRRNCYCNKMVWKWCPLCNASDLKTNTGNCHRVGLALCIGINKINVSLKVFYTKLYLQTGLGVAGGIKDFFSIHHCLLVYLLRHRANVKIARYLYRLARWRSSECHLSFVIVFVICQWIWIRRLVSTA